MSLGRPGFMRRLPRAAAVGAATLGPLGSLPAPGTFGSVAGTLYFHLCLGSLGGAGILLASALGGLVAVWFCGEAEERLGRRDPGEVILDEVVAMPLVFLGWRMIASPGTPGYWLLLLAGFALFRLFDIAKPWVIFRLQSLPGGWGVVIDDTAAALAACASLHLGHALWALR